MKAFAVLMITLSLVALSLGGVAVMAALASDSVSAAPLSISIGSRDIQSLDNPCLAPNPPPYCKL